MGLREDKRTVFGLLGRLTLAVYGVIPTFQPADFGGVYVAYGGIFIVFSPIWGFFVDKKKSNRYEFIGVMIVFVDVLVVFCLSLTGRYSVISFCNF